MNGGDRVLSVGEIRAIARKYAAGQNTSNLAPQPTLDAPLEPPAEPTPSLIDGVKVLQIETHATLSKLKSGQKLTEDDLASLVHSIDLFSNVCSASDASDWAEALDDLRWTLSADIELIRENPAADQKGLADYLGALDAELQDAIGKAEALQRSYATKGKPAVVTARKTGWVRVQRAAPYRGTRPMMFVKKSRDAHGRTEAPCCLTSEVAAHCAARTGRSIDDVLAEMRRAGVSVDCRF
jgi:hypothetical protein